MLPFRSRADIAHHVLGLTLRRERPQWDSLTVPLLVRGLSASAAAAAPAESPQHAFAREWGLGNNWESPTDLDAAAGPSAPRTQLPSAKRPHAHVAGPRGKRHGLSSHRSGSGPLPSVAPLMAQHLLACVYAVQPPTRGDRGRPSHCYKTARPLRPHVALSPGIATTDVIALAPPNAPLWKQWEVALMRPTDDAARAVPQLLARSREERISLAGLFPHLSLVHRFILKLSPTSNWKHITPSEHAALQHLWKEWLAVVARLDDMGMLPRQYGPEGFRTEPARFTPLLMLLTTEPFGGIKDQRLVVQPPSDPPTLDQAFDILTQIGHEPTVEHLMILLKKLPLEEILGKAVEFAGKRPTSPLSSAMLKIANRLTDPDDSYSKYYDHDRWYHRTTLKYQGYRLSEYEFTIGQVAMRQLEISSWWCESEPSTHWGKIVNEHRPLWTRLAKEFALQQSDVTTYKTPTEPKAIAVLLLLRDALFHSPRTSLGLAPLIHGDFDLADPIHLLRLLLCAGPDRQLPQDMPTAGAAYKLLPKLATEASFRILRAAGRRRLFPPVLEVCGLLAESQLMIPNATALYAAGAARYPEDLVALLPLLLRLHVRLGGSVPLDVVQSLLKLARETDRQRAAEATVAAEAFGATAGSGTSRKRKGTQIGVEAAMAGLFRKWNVYPDDAPTNKQLK